MNHILVRYAKDADNKTGIGCSQNFSNEITDSGTICLSSLTAKYTRETIGKRRSDTSITKPTSNQLETEHGTMRCKEVPSQISQLYVLDRHP